MTTAQPQNRGQVDAPLGQLPPAMTHAAMSAAFDEGAAVLLGRDVNWVVRYRDAWWVVYEHGWLRVTDPATVQDLDQAAVRLAQAESAAGREGDR